MGFITTILIILLVYYAIKILLKIFAPKILNYAGKKAEKHFREKFEGFGTQQQNKTTDEGEVIIDTNKNKNPKSSKNVGEYIDFEEID
jgi:UPF0716 family protein affecting phage T7 exclusion